ncbi:MAG: DUF2202 domain-containing protein [Sulfuricurvum sp.]|nr:DUF2202 domain-containing protein [Sulfuricurvum sp.]
MSKKIVMAVLASMMMSGVVCAATVTLDATKKASLLFMYQEEKVARDVYITLGKKYPTATTFSSIQSSEQTHMDTVESLCIKYGVNISNIDETKVGVFVLPELQALYNTLVIQGAVSLLEAQKVGVAIEKKDIIDILAAEVGMPSDVVKKFENLRAGSYNHLDAFNKAVAALQ